MSVGIESSSAPHGTSNSEVGRSPQATKPELSVVLCTCPAQDADRIARILLEERLVACVNVVGGVKSLYHWEGGIAEDSESLLVLKTPKSRYESLESRLQEIHPYEVPEVLSLDAADGADTYVSWVSEAVQA